ncbi:MAG: hypothetical protein JST92_23890 [Deltaproteobacteria bacterium]|nr:hypothetical protein [Deltaproteobacteria bacterium]
MIRTSSILALALSLTLCACGMHLIGGKAWFDDSGKQSLGKRAAFDLSCAEDKLTFAPLGEGNLDYKMVGVSGCDKKATYLFINNREWVMNSEGK